jgi:hypothetical protein
MRHCKNKLCGELLVNQTAYIPLCFACRHLAKRSFAIGVATVGGAWGVIQIVIKALHWLA